MSPAELTRWLLAVICASDGESMFLTDDGELNEGVAMQEASFLTTGDAEVTVQLPNREEFRITVTRTR